jgi:hypothetical protein
MEDLTSSDPFTIADRCEYRITEFLATTVASGLEQYRETT